MNTGFSPLAPRTALSPSPTLQNAGRLRDNSRLISLLGFSGSQKQANSHHKWGNMPKPGILHRSSCGAGAPARERFCISTPSGMPNRVFKSVSRR